MAVARRTSPTCLVGTAEAGEGSPGAGAVIQEEMVLCLILEDEQVLNYLSISLDGAPEHAVVLEGTHLIDDAT